jgi:murein DD-endopeptidase MepM/ murein hydrolase activator NlpD
VPAPRKTTLVALALWALLATATGASAQTAQDRQSAIEGKISSLRSQIDSAKQKEGVLSSEISSALDEIDSLEGDISSLTTRLAGLQSELAAHRERLARLQDRFEYQSRKLEQLKRDHAKAEHILNSRLIDIYENGEADTIEILFQVETLSDLIERVDFVNDIGREDQRIATRIKGLKIGMREAREETGKIKAQVAEATAVIEEKTNEAAAAREALLARQSSLAAAKEEKTSLLAGVREDRHEHEEDLDAMLAASAALAEQIRNASPPPSSGGGGGGGAPSSSGFIWPVNGVVTSGFGPRWGRMHEGIDISAPTGTSIRAAAGGSVIYAGSMSGYGNIVVVDHGGGLSTAYAHMSSIWVGGGSVSQGQGLGAVGCTGHCTGPHLHFEVRVNGSPRDPMGYL